MAQREKGGHLDQLESIRKQIDNNCERLVDIVNGHKLNLQEVINGLEKEFVDSEAMRENEMSRLKKVMSDYGGSSGSNYSRLDDVQTRVLTTLQDEVKKLEAKCYEKSVELKWEDQLEKDLALIGNIEVDSKLALKRQTDKEVNGDKETVGKKEETTGEGEVPVKEFACPYSSLKYPSVESYSVGSENDQLSGPAGVAVCHDNRFFVADSNNDRVVVYTQWGKIKCSFQQLGLMGFVNSMQGPWGVCCDGNNIFVTESKTGKQYAAVKKFDLKGKYLLGVVKFGNKEGEFVDPTGLDFDARKEELYVCDRLNNRVQVLTRNMAYKGIFLDRFIYQPRDIKVGSETVYILDGNDPCMHLFDKITCRIKTHLITQGPNKDVQSAWFFAMDSYGNLLISDRDSDLITVFNREGKLLCKVGGMASISFLKPTGIAVNAVGNIISVSEKPFGCVQIL